MHPVTKTFYFLFFTSYFTATMTLNSVTAAPLSTPDLDDIEYPEDEAPTQAEVNLGKLLYFDQRLSGNGNMSCATCHNPDHGFGDGLRVSIGSEGNQLTRHTPHLYNLAWTSSLFWDGRANTLEHQALMPISNPDEMNLSEKIMLNRIAAISLYMEQFKSVYGESPIDASLVSRALASFMRSIVSNDSPFDRYLAGNKHAISQEAVNGLTLFKGKAKCIECHDGPNFSDDSFHSLGIATTDKGRGVMMKDSSMNFRFKTPGLRNVTLTSPYMHDGSLPDLESVIRFYNDGGGKGPNKDVLIEPLNLTELEIRDLITFLSALTDPVNIERPNWSTLNKLTSNSD